MLLQKEELLLEMLLLLPQKAALPLLLEMLPLLLPQLQEEVQRQDPLLLEVVLVGPLSLQVGVLLLEAQLHQAVPLSQAEV